jgi:hypothetical protein
MLLHSAYRAMNYALSFPSPPSRWISSIDGQHTATLHKDTLEGAKSTRYRHAARHLAECRALASLIDDYGQFEVHDAFVARLRGRHSRKWGFWALVTPVAG